MFPSFHLFLYFFFHYFLFYCYPLWFGEDKKVVNKVYKFTFPSQEEKGMVSMWFVDLSIPFLRNTRRGRQFSDFINTKCDFFLFKPLIITVLFIMFIFPSKLKLNLSRDSLNLKKIIKIRFLLYFPYRLLTTVKFRLIFLKSPFFRGLFLEGLIYGGKFAFQNRLGLYFEGNLRLKID